MLNYDEDFKLSKEDALKVHELAKRASSLAIECGQSYPLQDADMDITLVHNRIGLKLEELAEADDSNFGHDVFGIRRHLNRETGVLEDFFLPRYAVNQ